MSENPLTALSQEWRHLAEQIAKAPPNEQETAEEALLLCADNLDALSSTWVTREEHEKLREWQMSVTVALGREGGAHYEDVPKHIRQLRTDRDQALYGEQDLENQLQGLEAQLTEARAVACKDDLGLSIDMLDADRMRAWADKIGTHGADITHWTSVGFITNWLHKFAGRLEEAVREIGILRASLAQRTQELEGTQQLLERITVFADEEVRGLLADLAQRTDELKETRKSAEAWLQDALKQHNDIVAVTQERDTAVDLLKLLDNAIYAWRESFASPIIEGWQRRIRDTLTSFTSTQAPTTEKR